MSGWVKKVNLIIFALQLYTHTHLRAARALWLQHFVLFGLSCWNVSFPRAAESVLSLSGYIPVVRTSSALNVPGKEGVVKDAKSFQVARLYF